jgi:hypothetical protein
MAAPVVESFSTDVNGSFSGSSVVLSKPTGTQDGDLLVFLFEAANNDVLSLTPPSGWTLIFAADNSSADDDSDVAFGGTTIAAYYREAGASEPSSYTFNYGGGGRAAAQMLRISGGDASSITSDSFFDSRVADNVASVSAPGQTVAADTLLISFLNITPSAQLITAVPSGATTIVNDQNNSISSSSARHTFCAVYDDFASGATGDQVFSQAESGSTNSFDIFDLVSGTIAIPPVGGGATEITTSGAPSIAAVTASGTAEVEKTSSGAVTVGAVTVSGSGDVTAEVTGSGAVTTAATEVSGAAEREITGSGAVETGATTVSGTAERELTSSGAVTTGAAEVDGTAEREITGSGAVETPAVTVDGTATTGAVINASGAVTIAAVTASGTAEREETSTGAVTVPGTTASGTGAVERKSTGAVTTPAAAVSGTAEREVAGSGAVTLPAVEVDGTAAAVAAGEASGNVIIAPVEVAGVAEREITGSGAITLPGIVVQGPQLDDEDTGGGGNHYSYDSEPILSEREYKALADAYMRTGRDDHPDKVSRQVRRAEARKNNSAEIPRTQQSIADFKPPKTSTAIGAIEALRRDIEYAKAERAQTQQAERVEAERQAQVERQRQQVEQLRLRAYRTTKRPSCCFWPPDRRRVSGVSVPPTVKGETLPPKGNPGVS